MNYIHITYDAVLEFTSGRTYQSAEYNNGAKICQLLRGLEVNDWFSARIMLKRCKSGFVFYTKEIDRKRGVCFDMGTFSVEGLSDDVVITIFQKTLKYAVKYFENLPLTGYEKQKPNTNLSLIYPYPFVASNEVDKICIDRNSSKLSRKEADFLTVFYFGNREDVNFTKSNLAKAYEEIKEITGNDLVAPTSEKNNIPLDVVGLENPELSIDATIGYDQWMKYLTEKQKRFIDAEVTGPERLEGAAGTGKTLSMILRCIRILKAKDEKGEEYRMIFITHSVATKEKICNIFRINWSDFDRHLEGESQMSSATIHVTTLQEWSAQHLGTGSIHESNYIDKDAAYSKGIQLLYIEQAYDKLRAEEEWSGYEPILSDELKRYLQYTPKENLLEMLQKEVAVIIKGRAKEDYEKYRKIKRPKYGVPVVNDADRNFMFQIFTYYQDELMKVGQYDSDDIILSAIGQIDTPIWRRRRIIEGYDACFIDETHLFNLNELSLFHFINKPSCANYIVFGIDRSQAVGEWNIDEEELMEQFDIKKEDEKSEKFSTVFRSSHDITCLAFNILSSGATLFTNFENPLLYSTSNFTREEDAKCEQPLYKMIVDVPMMVAEAFEWVDGYIKKHHSHKANVLITCTNDALMYDLKKYADQSNRSYEVLESRSDSKTIRKAKDSHRYLLGGIDYVGGLEFDAVVIVGVDGQRVPPSRESCDAYHYMRYAWHNRLYVAVTRAKYAICLLGIKSSGPSVVIESAIGEDYLEYVS